MRASLHLHPASICDGIARIEVDAERHPPRGLLVRYAVVGEISNLRLPGTRTPARTDELWSHTCFEVFVRAGLDSSYVEFTYSPSTEWASYTFDGYRQGMRPALELPAPSIETRLASDRYELEALQILDGRFAHEPWLLGVSAVIEDTRGRKSYWALVHPPGQPDFHLADCFALELPQA